MSKQVPLALRCPGVRIGYEPFSAADVRCHEPSYT
jgi:hypothetical protein